MVSPLTPVTDQTAELTPTAADRLEAARLLGRLLDSAVVLPDEWDELSSAQKADVCEAGSQQTLLLRLVNLAVLTPFQAGRIQDNKFGDLIVGSYRVLEPIGKGGMGVVYKAEHVHLRRVVALKMAHLGIGNNPRLLNRFYAEARAVARLNHPNIVTCLDAGRIPGQANGLPRDYFVLEFVPGQDLDAFVRAHGPLPVTRAAEIFRQVADALTEAHRHGLVHRDLKPSNIMVTPDWRVKLLDFGLVMHPRYQATEKNLTEPGTLLGSIGYMAPEQARDPRSVDGRADLFSLGASLYWVLTGKEPYPDTGQPIQDLSRRMTQPPPDIREVRPEIPSDVAELLGQLLQVDPGKRIPSAAALTAALTPLAGTAPSGELTPGSGSAVHVRHRVLVVGPGEKWGCFVTGLANEFDIHTGQGGLKDAMKAWGESVEAIVWDFSAGRFPMEELDEWKRTTPGPKPVVVAVIDTLAAGQSIPGADEVVPRNVRPDELATRLRTLITRRETIHTLTAASESIPWIGTGPTAVRAESAWDFMAATVSRLLTDNWYLAPGYRTRVARGVAHLAEVVNGAGEYGRLKDPAFVALLASCSAVYDIGLLVLPGGLPVKPGVLDDYEKNVIRTHPAVGTEILKGLAQSFPGQTGPITLAAEVTLGHHERWDGHGYPDGLAGTDIPLAARVVSLVSTYDSLRSRRPYRTPMTHARAIKLITTESPGRFDPILVSAFVASAAQFERTFQECPP